MLVRGGYHKVDAWGYQTLINYSMPRSPSQSNFEYVTLQDVLQGQLNPQSVKNRIVLIGVSAKSFGDLHTTPLSLQDAYPGVMIQAEMTSQLISAALGERPLLTVWPLWAEAIWIWGWLISGGLLFWVLGAHLLKIMGIGLVLGGGLYYLCWLFLIQGLWVPLVPIVLGLAGMGLSALLLLVLAAKRTRSIR